MRRKCRFELAGFRLQPNFERNGRYRRDIDSRPLRLMTLGWRQPRLGSRPFGQTSITDRFQNINPPFLFQRSGHRLIVPPCKMAPCKLDFSNPPNLFPARIIMAERDDGAVSTNPGIDTVVMCTPMLDVHGLGKGLVFEPEFLLEQKPIAVTLRLRPRSLGIEMHMVKWLAGPRMGDDMRQLGDGTFDVF